MNNRQFYRDCYLKTGGWIPMTPMLARLKLGDFGQIKPPRFNLLGNIFGLNLVEDIEIVEDIALNGNDWKLNGGVTQRHSETEQLVDERQQRSEWTKQLLSFAQPGSFFFHGEQPVARMVLNWSYLKKDVTLKLTQADFSFRDVIVVTQVATLDNWTLAVAGAQDARLELSAQTRTTDFFDLIGHQTCRAESSKDIETFERHIDNPGFFFKAKKLVLRDRKKEHYIRQALDQTPDKALDKGSECNTSERNTNAVANWLNTDMLNRVESNELNIATCLEFFDWIDLSLDDVEKLC